MKWVLAILVTLTLAAPTVAHTSEVQDDRDSDTKGQLIQIEDVWASAYAGRNTAKLERLLADEFTDTDETGTRSKRQYLAQLANLKATSDSFVFNDRTLRIYGEMGLTTGRVRWKTEAADKAGRYIAVYVRRDQRWQAVAFHVASPR
jgi:hypothetical protein